MKIAALYTCFNRKEKTLASLRSLYQALNKFNSTKQVDFIELEVYLTDDGCTDGTSDAIRKHFGNNIIHILNGNGSLYWSGGMLFAWKEAIRRHSQWDYYLLLNDDTILNADCFHELLKTDKYCVEKYGMQGLYSGITCATTDPNTITYGGDIYTNKFTGKMIRLGKSDVPQMVDKSNANILLVPKIVVDKIGIFFDGYKHGCADNDYSMMARKKGIPVLITANVCGICDNDHGDPIEIKEKIISMSLSERKAYFNHPIHSNSDHLTYIRRNLPARYPIVWIFRMLHMYFPRFYYRLNRLRDL